MSNKSEFDFNAFVNSVLAQLAAVPAESKAKGPSCKELAVGAGVDEEFSAIVSVLVDHDSRFDKYRKVKGPFGGVRPKKVEAPTVAVTTVETEESLEETQTTVAAE